jgi:hypothetical protein
MIMEGDQRVGWMGKKTSKAFSEIIPHETVKNTSLLASGAPGGKSH